MEKRWVVKEKGEPAVIRQLASALSVSESLANLMVQRNITTPAEAKAFFRPTLDYLHDPFLMKDMNIAVERISTAIKKNEKILVSDRALQALLVSLHLDNDDRRLLHQGLLSWHTLPFQQP
ncbi:MAG TPA: hypothetical protein VHO68_10205, partial [Bacteroidales bacterium]|nr:hypothetical protein [Bacteroidales bacterium]